ncbi:MAG: hypothetical protein ACFFC6_14660, partial [Promethearchaeota archaeon]
MLNDLSKFQISLESEKGLEKLISFIRQKKIFELPTEEGDLKEKLLIAKQKLGFKNYLELLDFVENNQDSFTK